VPATDQVAPSGEPCYEHNTVTSRCAIVLRKASGAIARERSARYRPTPGAVPSTNESPR
jgi:hypothetical protein